MNGRKIEDRYTRSLYKTGGGKTYTVTLPIDIIRELKWQSKQKVEVRRNGDRIMITDWKPGKK